MGTAEAAVHLTGLSMSPQNGLTAGNAVTFTASAISEEGGTIYYLFNLVPNYGSNQYDPNNNYTTIQAFSTRNTCTYTFNSPGDYIVVVFASPTMDLSAGTAIIGKNISIGRSNTVHLGSLDLGLTGSVAVGQTLAFGANARSDNQATVYYRFDLIPNYGTDQYDPDNNYTTLQEFSTRSSCSYTFSSPGKYILVVFASYGQGTFYDAMPIAGGSISVTSNGSPNSNHTGNQEFDLNNAQATDPLYGFRSETPASTLIPTSIDYSAKMPNVKSQGSTSSCTSWATGYYYKTYQEALEEGWDRNQNTFSPMYLYSLQCRNYAQPWSFIAAWETLNQNGCAKYTTMPFVDLSGSNEKSDYSTVTIPSAATSEARNYRCGERNQLEGLSQVKQALTQSPVLLGINKYSNLHLSSSWHPSPENNYLTYDASNSNVGHAILCVGYDDSKFGTGALKFINSWGQDWAIDGFSWVRYSDYSNIVIFSMSIQDIPNANRPDNTNSRPAAPANVSATDNAGPYVDVTWSAVSTAQYYRIFRAKVGDSSTYSEIGTAYQTSFRDNPEAGVNFYYSVVSYNDVGNSDHYASDTDAKAYVDKGAASGSTMSKPVVNWLNNDNANIRSNFSVSNLSTNASAMEVFVAISSAGPWHSFGWATPGSFYISWGQDSEYIGKKPFVKIVVSSTSGTSEASNPVQVGQTLVSTVNVADITSLQASPQSTGIRLNWSTNGGAADFFEIWRWLAAEDEGNEWIFIGYADGTATTYTDTLSLPGKNYYYAVAAVYRGTYGEFVITDEPASMVSNQANLFLYQVVYDAGEIYNPANFEVTVWNDGGTAIGDYSILIYVYDWDDGEFYYPFDEVYASDYTYSTLYPGYSHTLYMSLDLPSDIIIPGLLSWTITMKSMSFMRMTTGLSRMIGGGLTICILQRPRAPKRLIYIQARIRAEPAGRVPGRFPKNGWKI
jgi:C1A family cysteine protease